ncbi:MAG TPA: hypothetical protein VJW73_02900 [Gemmatimonadaceae bacterium]|nr:hypothetical protein [Gemmatimonadaceae bacterium]
MTAAEEKMVRVFVNAVGVMVPAGSSILDAVRRWNESEGTAVADGEKMVTDSRGLPIDADKPVSAGSIFRLVPVRKRGGAREYDDDRGSEDQ